MFGRPACDDSFVKILWTWLLEAVGEWYVMDSRLQAPPAGCNLDHVELEVQLDTGNFSGYVHVKLTAQLDNRENG